MMIRISLGYGYLLEPMIFGGRCYLDETLIMLGNLEEGEALVAKINLSL